MSVGWPGEPFPLGATWDGDGTNFSLFSEHATAVTLCLFDDAGTETRVPLGERTAHMWHIRLPGVRPGQRYGYRVDGPWEPHAGQRFNPAKLLIDPYAKAIDGPIRPVEGGPLMPPGEGDDADLVRDERDSAGVMPRCIVIDPAFDWEGDSHPRTPWHRTVIYEAHVRGLTMRHPTIREDLRGTYAGLASEAAIAHLTRLGVTAIELLPVHQIADEPHLTRRGLTNHWGYSSIGFFAPHSGYAATGTAGEQVREFKGMVKALHRAGIEVILDVVYNHTAEGGHAGPTLSFRGIDNLSYYRCAPDDPRRYVDFTGTGNSLNPTHPSVLRLIMDSLRYWVLEMHVDGFRFDLASALAREFYDVHRLSSFFDVIHQDPVLSQVKLIAEPWDVGPGGYQVGNFPVLWTEWNGLYRDGVRDFWRGQAAGVADLASRLTGSSDLYQNDGRHPFASINFVTAHDGFTMADLVSHDHKHNEANLEDNRDGTDDNRSWNHGVEGPTDDPAIRELRARQVRNMLSTLFLSQGVPMLLAGDEMGRTQGGNNNAYCQDNEISWIDWDLDDERRALFEFTRRLNALRRAHPVLRRRNFFGGADGGSGLPDIRWLRCDGRAMSRRDWARDDLRTLGVFMNGEEIPAPGPTGEPVLDDSFVLLLNASDEPVRFRLPARRFGNRWRQVLSTAEPDGQDETRGWSAWARATVEARSLLLLRRAW